MSENLHNLNKELNLFSDSKRQSVTVHQSYNNTAQNTQNTQNIQNKDEFMKGNSNVARNNNFNFGKNN
jgi:hypothetical protein